MKQKMEFNLDGDAKGFTAAMGQAAAATKQFEQKFVAATNKSQRELMALNNSFSSFTNLFKGGIAGLAAYISASGIIGGLSSVAQRVGELNDTASQLNLDIMSLQAFQQQAQLAGVGVQDLTSKFARFQDTLGNAREGNQQAIDLFNKLGISLDTFGNSASENERLIIAVGDALNNMEDPAQRAALANDLFGRNSARIIAALAGGADKINTTKQALEEFGGITAEQAQKIDEYADRIEVAYGRMRNAAISFIGSLLPATTEIAKQKEQVAALTAELDSLQRGMNDNRQIFSFVPDKAYERDKKRIEEIKKEIQAIEAAQLRTTLLDTPLQESFRPAEKPASSGKSSSGNSSGVRAATVAIKEQTAAVKELGNAYVYYLDDGTEISAAGVTELNKELIKSQDISKDLGLTFTSAFEEAIVGAKGASEALRGLGQDIVRIMTRRLVTEPVGNSISSFASQLLPKFSSFLPSFDVGSFNVPRDMVANIHKGEMIIPAKEASAIRSGGMGGNTYNIDARGADAGAVARLEASLLKLAGPGKIEQRVMNASRRGAL